MPKDDNNNKERARPKDDNPENDNPENDNKAPFLDPQQWVARAIAAAAAHNKREQDPDK